VANGKNQPAVAERVNEFNAGSILNGQVGNLRTGAGYRQDSAGNGQQDFRVQALMSDSVCEIQDGATRNCREQLV
jgi:hypothetical protein